MLLPSLALLLLCTAALAVVVGLYARRVHRQGRPDLPRLGPSPGSALAPGWLVEALYWSITAPGELLARLGVDPDALTYLALAFSLASAPLIATGQLPLGAVAVLVGGGFDALDGMVARARGVASPAGAVLDSFVDRLSDAAPFAGLALFYRASALALLVPLVALVGSSLVSYARARADLHRLTLPAGVMRRHERVGYLVVALLLAPVIPAAAGILAPLTLGGVALIALGSLGAALVLVARTRAALRGSAVPSPGSSVPAARQ